MRLLSFGALAMLAAIAFIACYLPAWRAGLVNPVEALGRSEARTLSLRSVLSRRR